MKISLAKALKVKNELAGKLNKFQNRLRKFNSVDEKRLGNIPNRSKTFEEILKVSFNLAKLKGDIAQASSPIYPLFHAMNEKKSFISFLQELSTKHGEYAESKGFQKEPEEIKYDAFMDEIKVNKLVDKLEEEISQLQDKIDEINATTFIDFEE